MFMQCFLKKNTGLMPVGVLFVLFVTMSTVSSMPLRASDSLSKAHQNASYNKSYTVQGKTYHPMRTAAGYKAVGVASWYGAEAGNLTAMGARFHAQGLTAAHKTLPLPSKVRVTNLRNGRSVDVVVNDRGPFKNNRLIDLSHGAAKIIGLDKQGLSKVRVVYLDR